jgi:WD40 repeat protein
MFREMFKKFLLILLIACIVQVTGTASTKAQFERSPWAIDWSPDGRFIAAGYSEGTITILDRHTGQELSFRALGGAITDIAWNPQSTKLAACIGADLQIFDTAGNLVLDLSDDNRYQASALSWSPDGERLANTNQYGMGSGLARYSITIWDVQTGQLLSDIETDWYKDLHSIDWSPDGSKIAVGAAETITIIDAATELPLVTLTGHSYNVTDLSWSPDGSKIASASQSPDSSVRVWDAATGALLAEYQGTWTKRVDWNPDGNQLALTDNNSIVVVDATTMQTIEVFGGIDDLLYVFAVSWSPDGSELAYAGLNGEISIVESVAPACPGHPLLPDEFSPCDDAAAQPAVPSPMPRAAPAR